MFKMNRAISTIVLVCFLFNTAFSDLAFGQTINFKPNTDKLAPPLKSSDIVGIQHKDLGDIELSFIAFLMGVNRNSGEITVENMQKYYDSNTKLLGKTMFQLPGAQLFIHEVVTQGDTIRIKLQRKDDKHGLRTYYVEYTPSKQGIKVYTEEQYKATNEFTKGIPTIKAEDAKAIQRYVDHEEGIDRVIAYAHEKGLAKEPIKGRFDYKASVTAILKRFNIIVENPDGLIPIEDREFFLIPLSGEIERMMTDLPKARVIGADGKEHEVTYFAHSSNHATHLFVSGEDYQYLTNKNYHREGAVALAVLKAEIGISHEIGAICARPVLRIEKDKDGSDIIVNDIDARILASAKDVEGRHLRVPIVIRIANLDYVELRDYAAGGVSFGKLAKLIAAKLNWPEINILVNRAPDVENKFMAALVSDDKIIAFYSFKLEKGKVVELKKLPNDNLNALDRMGKPTTAQISQAKVKQSRDQAGKSPKDAMIIMAEADEESIGLLSQPGLPTFTLKDYLRWYEDHGEYSFFDVDPLAEKHPDSTARRDLNANVKKGYFKIVNKGEKGEPYIYKLTEKGRARLEVLHRVLRHDRRRDVYFTQYSGDERYLAVITHGKNNILRVFDLESKETHQLCAWRELPKSDSDEWEISFGEDNRSVRAISGDRFPTQVELKFKPGAVSFNQAPTSGIIHTKPDKNPGRSGLGGGMSAEQLQTFALRESTMAESLIAYLNETGLFAQQADAIREILRSDPNCAGKLARFEALLAKLESATVEIDQQEIIAMTSLASEAGLQEILKLVPVDYIDGWLKHNEFKEALKQAECKGSVTLLDDNSTLIFSERAAFGEYKDGRYEEGIGILLPSFIRSGVKVAVIAATDKQRALIDELNAGKPKEQQIVCEDSILEVMAKIKTARYCYFKIASEPDAGIKNVLSISIIVKKIIDAIGSVTNITDHKLIEQMHEAARRFAIAA